LLAPASSALHNLEQLILEISTTRNQITHRLILEFEVKQVD
jgi:hypothetical protein